MQLQDITHETPIPAAFMSQAAPAIAQNDVNSKVLHVTHETLAARTHLAREVSMAEFLWNGV